MLAAGLAAVLLVATCAAIAQPVAKLEVVPKALTQHEKLDRLDAGMGRLERKVDQLIELHRAAPPVEPPPGPPKPPIVPPPPPPPPPADNPFVAWCAGGSTVLEYMLWRNGGQGLSPAQEAQARAAGCFGTPTPPGPGGGPAAPPSTGNDLSDTAPHYFTFYEGQAQTFTCSVPTARHVDLVLFTSSGSTADGGVDSGPGFSGRTFQRSGTDFRWVAIAGPVPAGTITYTVALRGILSHAGAGQGTFGLQCFR